MKIILKRNSTKEVTIPFLHDSEVKEGEINALKDTSYRRVA